MISANLTSPSSSIHQRILSKSADKFKTPSSSVDQTFISPPSDQTSDLLFPEKSSILRSTEKASLSVPTSSADQTSLSASDLKTSHFLSANETSLQSGGQPSACRPADKNGAAYQENSSSVPSDQDILPLFPSSSGTVSDPQRPSYTSPSHDQMSYPTPSPEKTRPSSPPPGKTLSSLDDQERSSLLLDAQSNSSSAVYHQTGSLADTICDSSPSVVTSGESLSKMENMDDMRSSVPGPSSVITTGPSVCQGRPLMPSPNDAMVPIPGGSLIPIQLSQSTTSCDAVPGSATIGPVMSGEIAPTALTSLTSVQTIQEISKSDLNVEETRRFPGPSVDEKSSSFSNQEGSTIPLDFQSNSSSVVDYQTGSLADVICDCSTNVEGSSVARSITETIDEMPPSDPSPPCSIPSGSCHSISSAPTCISGRAAIRPLISCEVTPPAIPSLMSIKTTPPASWSNDYAFDTRFSKPARYPTPRNSAPRPHGDTSSAHEGAPERHLTPLMDVQTTPPASWSNDYVRPITPLMSIQTSLPVPCNGIRPLRNHGNRRGVPAPSTSTIASLMSIQTRPSRGTRRPQSRG